MNREKLHHQVDLALNGNYGSSRRIELHKILDIHYDEFQNRKCENCKYWAQEKNFYLVI